MAEELDFDLDQLEEQVTLKDKIQKRIIGLKEKETLITSERDELKKLNDQMSTDKVRLEKENTFLSSFTDSISKYPLAKEFRDKIKEKVMAGYDVEDATISVLAKEGKLNSPNSLPPEKNLAAGGSAANQMKGTGPKPVSEMTQAEKRTALLEAEAKGEISV